MWWVFVGSDGHSQRLKGADVCLFGTCRLLIGGLRWPDSLHYGLEGSIRTDISLRDQEVAQDLGTGPSAAARRIEAWESRAKDWLGLVPRKRKRRPKVDVPPGSVVATLY